MNELEDMSELLVWGGVMCPKEASHVLTQRTKISLGGEVSPNALAVITSEEHMVPSFIVHITQHACRRNHESPTL